MYRKIELYKQPSLLIPITVRPLSPLAAFLQIVHHSRHRLFFVAGDASQLLSQSAQQLRQPFKLIGHHRTNPRDLAADSLLCRQLLITAVDFLTQLFAPVASGGERISKVLGAHASFLPQNRSQLIEHIGAVPIFLLPAPHLQPAFAADLIDGMVVHLFDAAGASRIQLLGNQLGCLGDLPQRLGGIFQPIQHQSAHTFVRTVCRHAEDARSQRLNRPGRQKHQSHRRDERLIQQRQYRRCRRDDAECTEGHGVPSGTAKPSQTGKHSGSQSSQRINPQQLHLGKQGCTDRCPTDDACNCAPAFSTDQRTDEHHRCCNQPSQRNSAQRHIAQGDNQHRSGQHHTDHIGTLQSEHSLSQRKNRDAAGKKIGAGSRQCCLCKSHNQVIHGKRRCKQYSQRGQQHPCKGKQRRTDPALLHPSSQKIIVF